MTVLLWYLLILLIGVAAMPFCLVVFDRFEDGGWMFAKSIGLFVLSYIIWTLNCLHIVPFRGRACVILFCILAIGAAVFYRSRRDKIRSFASLPTQRILIQEIAFLFLFLLWTYIIGFNPDAMGTEKFMDYGFLTSMYRSDYMPFADMWYAGENINYYYGGQYITTLLIKMSGVTTGEGYTLMRALIAAFSFSLPASLVIQFLSDLFSKKETRLGGHLRERFVLAGGGIAGLAAAFAGNGHYVIFGIIGRLLGKDYWFPDTTRYIGYDPDTADKTIHEFPAYSTVLGDLHAHYINLIFVFTAVAIAYAYAKHRFAAYTENETHGDRAEKLFGIPVVGKDGFLYLREILGRPEILLVAFFTGVFRWTNFWDFPIYFVVCGSLIFFSNLKRYLPNWKRFVIVMAAQACVMFLAGKIFALPFTLTFDQISSEIGLTHSHTPLYQLLILWGLPVGVTAVYICGRILDWRRDRVWPALPDLSAGLLGLCAAGLVWLPEVIYVKDIYISSHYRANTMFKLTYQAFVLFAMVMGYALARAFAFWYKDLLERRKGLTVRDRRAESAPVAEEGYDPDLVPHGEETSGGIAYAKDVRKNTVQLASEDTEIGETDSRDGDAIVLAEEPDFRESMTESMTDAEDIDQILESERSDAEDAQDGSESAEKRVLRRTSAKSRKEPKFTKDRQREAGFVLSVAALVLLVLTLGYTPHSIRVWFGNIFAPSQRVSTDASVFVYESYPTDFGAISWLNENAEGQPVILEANGDSYSERGRVSVATGLPTVLGWYVHEWLWRNDTEALNERSSDILKIYTSSNQEEVEALIKKYAIRYLYIGGQERDAFPDLNDTLLQSLGEVVYSDGLTTYIVEIPET